MSSSRLLTLLPHLRAFRVDAARIATDGITLDLQVTRRSARCPLCGARAMRAQSTYRDPSLAVGRAERIYLPAATGRPTRWSGAGRLGIRQRHPAPDVLRLQQRGAPAGRRKRRAITS